MNVSTAGHRLDAQFKPADGAIRIGKLVLHSSGRTLVHAAPQDLKHGRLINARIHRHHGLPNQGFASRVTVTSGGIIDVKIAPIVSDDLAAFQQVVEGAAVALFVF